MSLDPKIWGPHYWFFLHTIALNYPHNPNVTVKKKYYDFFQNLPIFIPITNIGNYVSELLDRYPLTPYLDNRESLIKWVHFIHNEINKELGDKEISIAESLHKYYEQYRKPGEKIKLKSIAQEYYIFIIIFILLISISIYLYRKS
tara:strand:+ start:107 stop:541 length:435 start_codon:yes stop_codon:yes gene_type:complete